MEEEHRRGSRKLIRCLASNGAGQASTRYVELEYFRLWEYMMSQRHGFEIRDLGLCMWLDVRDFQRHAAVFEHAGEVRPVTRLEAIIYDARHGYDIILNRYAPADETERMSEVLRSHVPEDVLEAGRFELRTRPGYAVERSTPIDPDHFVLGLSTEFG